MIVTRGSLDMDLLWLGEPACHERARVGGKAAQLSRLAASQRVPPGFCLTAAALDRALAGNLALGEGSAGLPRLPRALYNCLVTAYQSLAQRCGVDTPGVAVRSSAVDEDAATASFAGQYETLLNVVGPEALAQAVLRCWASAHAPRARAYRRRQGLASQRVRLAVLVQQLIPADVAAVLFSAHPVTGSRDEIVINASWGLGESIVGGTVTPDSYVVRKADLTVVARQVAEKRRMTVPVPGGTFEVAVSRLLREQPALTDGQVAEMARLGLALEAHMGWPVDVECAYQAADLYLLQCRPITTLRPSTAKRSG